MAVVQLLVTLVLLALAATFVLKRIVRVKETPRDPRNPAYGTERVVSLNVPLLATTIIVLLVAVTVLWESMGQVAAGERGVVLQFGAVTGEVKSEGLYFVTPFINTVEMMDVKVQKHATKATAASKDLQNVATEIALNYRVSPDRSAFVYQSLRREYESRIIDPSVQEAVKAVTAGYNAEELITKRALVRDAIENALRARLGNHGILLDQLSITDFAFDREFSAAIEAKMVAAQLALKADNDLKRIKVEAEQRIAQAQGEAEAIRIQVEAIRQQGGAEYVRLKAIEKWGGVLPTWMGGNGPVPFIEVR